ncbi:hypothetical protein VTL71DRAFT_4781 [Oculimacula yallundae]|uniref:Diacylglycerol O-acyltransferase n=1 Tax=Oculimacula yallundae TaxID=86028 RepID=A0ABR4C3K9_9HELO
MESVATRDYRLLRPAGPLEVLTSLFHDLGIQSNVRVSCSYSHETKTLLPARVLRALQKVIEEIPALSIIGVSQQSTKKVGNHRTWDAKLPFIRFRDCVEFLDVENINDDSVLARIYEDIHNTWFDTKDTTKPWWKLVVVNHKLAIFVFHHSIADGMSGYAFHRSLLAALNADDADQESDHNYSKVDNQIFTTDNGSRNQEPIAIDEIHTKLSWFHVIRTFLFWTLIRVFIRPKYLFFSDAIVTPTFPTYSAPFPVSERTRSRVQILRIPHSTMEKVLARCREHKTSFTALLHTIICVTFAVDVYPQATIGFSRMAVNIRSLMRRDPGLDVFTNASATYYRTHFLSRYRSTVRSELGALDQPAIWNLVKAYKNHMHTSIHENNTVLQGYLTCRLLGEDNEEVGSFYGLGLYLNNSFLISNIGVFKPRDDMEDGGWTVTDAGFGAGAIRASVGDIGPVFSVASVEWGRLCDCGDVGGGCAAGGDG